MVRVEKVVSGMEGQVERVLCLHTVEKIKTYKCCNRRAILKEQKYKGK